MVKEELDNISNPIKEASSYKGIDGDFDTALQWIWLFGGKELLRKRLEIYSPSNNFRFFKKAMEDGKITIQDLDKVTKGEYGQTNGIPFSQTAIWKQDIKPYLDRVKQNKINDLNIDLEEELTNKLKEATHPWYTSTDGYYAGERKAGGGPRHTGNVIDYLKPGTLVYNVKGNSKNIKDLTDTHLMFTDGTEDYFMNWFPQKPLSEESATGAIGVGAGPIQTPYAFAPKGQKTNKATKTAIKQGFKKASGMPKNSKMLDYKELWKGKKSAMNEMENTSESIKVGDKLKHKLTGAEMVVTKVNGNNLTTKIILVSNLKTGKVGDINKTNALLVGKTYDLIKESKSLEESITNIIKEELLNETSYNKFKNEVKYRTKNEMLHKSIREVKRKLEEVERLVEYTTRIKQELSENEDGVSYWKRSLKAINEISEVSNKISNKIKSIYQ
jgi:hypothetical protein